MGSGFREISNAIWNIANHLRGSWKAHEYQDVVLPLLVLKRLDAALEPTKEKLLELCEQHGTDDIDINVAKRVTKYPFYNCSAYTISKLLDEPTHIARNLRKYVAGFSPNVREVFERFKFDEHIGRLEKGGLLYLILREINSVVLHPDDVPNDVIGHVFEDLIRRFAEQSNETAGEHYTPRDVVRLMATLAFVNEEEALKKSSTVTEVYDPACGTGGMLTVSKKLIQENYNEKAKVYLYGQELNPQTYAVCKADMLLKGEDPDLIRGGQDDHSQASTLSNDQHAGKKFDYVISNPPYGVSWEKDEKPVKAEYERGTAGRFHAGLPRKSDGQFLFIEHIISKLKPTGADAVVITNGSPLFTGGAGQGESEIRRWLLADADYVDTIIALPEQLFFNTGIATYIWVLSNKKPKARKGKVMLLDAREMRGALRRNLGHKRYEIRDEDVERIVKLYRAYKEGDETKIFPTSEFGYRFVTIQQPLKFKFDVTDEALKRLEEDKKMLKLQVKDDQLHKGIFTALKKLNEKSFMSLDQFVKTLKGEFEAADIKVSDAHLKTIWSAIGEQDDEAEVITDGNGNPVPDSDLKDTERVPLSEAIEDYFKREVKPYAGDAWIDESVTDDKDGEVGKVGYEINFNRYFYKYEPPRDPDELLEEIREIESEIRKSLESLN